MTCTKTAFRLLQISFQHANKGFSLVSSPLDDLCIDIWISAMSQHPDTRETGDSNVLAPTRPIATEARRTLRNIFPA